MEASIKLPRANVKDQNPHTQKRRQIDVKRGNMSMHGSPKPLTQIRKTPAFKYSSVGTSGTRKCHFETPGG